LKVPLLFQPNAGSPQIAPGGVIYPQGPQEFARFMGEILSLGVTAVGGCCGTDGQHIRALRKAIDDFQESSRL